MALWRCGCAAQPLEQAGGDFAPQRLIVQITGDLGGVLHGDDELLQLADESRIFVTLDDVRGSQHEGETEQQRQREDQSCGAQHEAARCGRVRAARRRSVSTGGKSRTILTRGEIAVRGT